MHEYHIVEDIVRRAAEAAAKNGTSRVTEVRLALGELSGLSEESVRFYFDEISRGTALEGARLSIKFINAKLRCDACGITFERRKGEFGCPACGKAGLPAGAGRECYIEEIEID
jgi:hydrogenase nickel incorporation protein HypA/HybF